MSKNSSNVAIKVKNPGTIYRINHEKVFATIYFKKTDTCCAEQMLIM